ncbi:SgcJ/EcaC family oxidoreductase [Hymenobacter sp.]|uniref:YybH family protein n=1 Tax=Hymenobacter sp. TaxID=1898978 RepID=UPI00286C2BF2|nr:SgcJ/EcaC family oxidoreductase [Hymenobacter sp.]
MATQSDIATEETQIRELIDAGARAVRAKDIDGLMPAYAPEVVSFDVVGRLHYQGAAAVRKRTEEWFASFEGPISYEVSDLSVSITPDMAFCHRINHVRATKNDGGHLDMRWRETTCYRRRGGQWLIVHQHSSVPFDAASGQASLDLQP